MAMDEVWSTRLDAKEEELADPPEEAAQLCVGKRPPRTLIRDGCKLHQPYRRVYTPHVVGRVRSGNQHAVVARVG